MRKEGISPLVATLFLIGFSVGLGAVVMSWGERYVEEKAQFVKSPSAEVAGPCSLAKLDVVYIKGLPRLCSGPNNIEVYLEAGPADIAMAQASVVGRESVDVRPNILSTAIMKGGIQKVVFTHSFVGDVLQVKFIPYADGELCNDNAVVVEDVVGC